MIVMLGTFLLFRAIFSMAFLLNVFLFLLFRDFSLTLIIWALLIMRTYNLPLAVLQLFLGYCLAWIGAKPFLVIHAIFSSFFYLASVSFLLKLSLFEHIIS